MYKRILLPTDGSDITPTAIEHTLGLARLSGAKVYALCVKEPFPYSVVTEMQPSPPQEYYDAQERIAASRVKQVQDACDAAGVPCEAHTLEALHPWEAIIEHARTRECELIVMASHGRRGVAALLLGSETTKVLTHTKIPVLVVR